jgi:hypothetical protein
MSEGARNDELEQLLERLCLDELDSKECASLESMIADNSDAQRRYVEVLYFREGLAYLLSHGEAGLGAAPLATDEAATEAQAPATPRASVEPGLRKRPNRIWLAHLGNLRQKLPSWATAASISFVAGALIAIFAFRGNVEMADRDDVAPRRVLPATSTPSPFLEDLQLGKISGLSLEASAEGLLQSMQVGQVLRCGEVVQLPTGFMRVQLDGGPELLVEGPAEFSLLGEESIFFRTGRVAASGGRRLLLQTPLLTAECLDARASFEVTDDDSASIHVSEGVVTVMTTPQAQVESEQVQVLHSGEGLVAEPADVKNVLRTTARGPLEHVVHDWREIESRLSKYQQLVLSDRPIAYWPLYRIRKNRRVLDLTQNGHDGLPIGNWPTELKAGDESDDSGRGVYFNGERYIEPDRKPSINLQSGFTIEGWAKPEGPAEYQAIFTSRWVVSSYTPNQQCYGVTLYAGDTNRWEFWTGRGRLGEFWNVMETPETIDRSAWTHVVGVFTPTESKEPGFLRGVGRLYVNGKQALELDQEVSLTDFDWPARIGAAEFVPRYLTSWLFKGYLSDISLYGYPLEVERIQKHFEVGQPTASSKTSETSPWGYLTVASLQRRQTP